MKRRLCLIFACLFFGLMTITHWGLLAKLESTGDVYASKRPYPPYLYVSDFTQFYAVGKLAASSERALVYDPQAQDRYLNQVIAPLHTTKICYGQNVPWFFMLMAPFTSWPLRQAYFLYCALGIVFGSLGLALVLRSLRKLPWLETCAMVLACNAAMPAWFALNHGNTSYYLLGFACLYVTSLRAEKDWIAGLALALLAQKPQYAIPASLPAFRFQRWKLIGAAAAVEFAIWVGSALYLGPENILNYPKTLFSTDTNSNLDGMYPRQMVSVRAMYATFISEHASMPLACATFALGLLLLFWMWLKVKKDDARQFRWAMAVTVMAMLVMSPHTSMYDVLLLSLPVVLTLPVESEVKKPAAASAWTWLIAGYPFTSWFLYLIEDPMVPFQHRYIAFFNVLLLAILVLSYFNLFGRRKVVAAQQTAQAN
jgi:hypothetical protein